AGLTDDPTTMPPEDGTPPTDETVPPTEETVPPTEETVPPTEETVPPTEETVPPTEETVPPTEETVPPTEETVPPTEETVPTDTGTGDALDDLDLAAAQADDDLVIAYTPAADAADGTETFEYTVCLVGAEGECPTALARVEVSATANEPTLVDDVATTVDGSAVTIEVLDNDSHPSGNFDGMSVRVVPGSGPTAGTATPAGAGHSITYTPDPLAVDADGTSVELTDQFRYEVCDRTSQCWDAMVTVTVLPEGSNPTRAADDTATVERGQQVLIDVLANDDFLDDVAVQLVAAAADADAGAAPGTTALGTVEVRSDNRVLFEASSTVFDGGTETFDYTLCDPAAEANAGVECVATVTIEITDSAPAALKEACADARLMITDAAAAEAADADPMSYVEGTMGDDLLVGTEGADVICGGPGRDRVFGLAGDDTLFSAGDGLIYGGAGDDMLHNVVPSSAMLDGGDGNDVIETAGGGVEVIGGDGDDDIMLAMPVEAGAADTTAMGPDPDAVNRVEGGPGADVIVTGPETDVVDGGPGDDLIGHDAVRAGAGELDDGRDDGDLEGAGTLAVAQGPDEAAAFVELSPLELTEPDTLRGGPGNDVIRADGRSNLLRGGSGDDILWGNSGNDTILGDDGVDTIVGASGRDLLFGGAGDDAEISGGPDDDHLWGGPGNDALLVGGAGEDRVNGGLGDDMLDGVTGEAPDLPEQDDLDGFDGADSCVVGTFDVHRRCEQVQDPSMATPEGTTEGEDGEA
ncbi:MAG: Ig-like domain-containing protein, partial [Actinomycetota bacterium]|nr:Ig-like domain-containing protein [Actinomycetota bacterium]